MIHEENTWQQSGVVPNLNIQILYMDKAYLEKGEDYSMWKEETEENTPQPLPPTYYYDESDLVCFNLPGPLSFYFDYGLTPEPYEHSREFTDKFTNSKAVSVFYIPAGTFGAILKLK